MFDEILGEICEKIKLEKKEARDKKREARKARKDPNYKPNNESEVIEKKGKKK